MSTPPYSKGDTVSILDADGVVTQNIVVHSYLLEGVPTLILLPIDTGYSFSLGVAALDALRASGQAWVGVPPPDSGMSKTARAA